MSYQPVTSFRRLVDAAQLEHLRAVAAPLPPQPCNKWDVLRDLRVAGTRFGLSYRGVAVIEALLGFHKGDELGSSAAGFIVHASNAAICERLNGMPCSTMRRHLAAAIRSGLVARQDSPNGKRYVRRHSGGAEAFGLDLSPLARRIDEIRAAADAVREERAEQDRLRQDIALMRRDLSTLVEYGRTDRPDLPLWATADGILLRVSKIIRRKLDLRQLAALRASLEAVLDATRATLELRETSEPSTKNVQNEHHNQSSEIDLSESSRSPLLQDKAAHDRDIRDRHPGRRTTNREPSAPLRMILSTCREIVSFTPDPINTWHDLVRAAETVSGMMGISRSVLREAAVAMGAENTATVIAAILERFTEIRSPGAYLRTLVEKAKTGRFTPLPMIAALEHRNEALLHS